METKVNPSAISVVLVSMAAASLFIMLSLNQINYIIHGDLYNYGLEFSYRWAMPYWIFSGIVFGLSWATIAISIIITLYIFKKKRTASLNSENNPQSETQRKLSEYTTSQEKSILPKEECAETSGEEFTEEEIKQHEETEGGERNADRSTKN